MPQQAGYAAKREPIMSAEDWHVEEMGRRRDYDMKPRHTADEEEREKNKRAEYEEWIQQRAAREEQLIVNEIHRSSKQIQVSEGILERIARDRARARGENLAILNETQQEIQALMEERTLVLLELIRQLTLHNRHVWDPVPHPPPHE